MEGGKDQSNILVLVGPWGGDGGTSWDDGIYDGVREITLVYDLCIDSIRVVYDKNGKPVTAEKHGGTGGSKTAEIKLQYPEEYLVSVSGYYGRLFPIFGPLVIRCLTFKSNKRTFGPYGEEEGTPFTPSMDGASIVGLMGRAGWYLDALSFRLSRVQSTKLFQKEGGKDQSNILVAVGPWGGDGGTSWDDGIYDGVREITLVYDLCIDSIRVVYDKNGKPVTAEKHGGTGGSKTAEIKLQYPEEYLVSVSGYYCRLFPIFGPLVIRSLTFKSNKRTFGPYGEEEGTPFTPSMDGASIVGLMGRAGWYLDALSFRLSRVQSTTPSCVQSTMPSHVQSITRFQKVQKWLQRLTSTVKRTNSIAN